MSWWVHARSRDKQHNYGMGRAYGGGGAVPVWYGCPAGCVSGGVG